MAQQLEIYARELAQYYHESRRLETALHDQMAELKESRQRIVVVEEALRKEIAELLHGRVQTKLLVAWHKLGQCLELLDSDPTLAKALLSQTRDELDSIREKDVRQAAHLLHPSIIQIGILPAIQTLAGAYKEHFCVGIVVGPGFAELDDPLENRIPEPTRLVIYRILEEAITNVYRHAKATHVEISLHLSPSDCLSVVIADNGKGFDVSVNPPGLGLTSIADRVGSAGGTWEIESAVGMGTTLRVCIPLAVPAHAIGLQGRALRYQLANV